MERKAVTALCCPLWRKREMFDRYMTEEEKLILRLRSLWSEAGYRSEKVSAAEEYDFYVRNKDFLSNREIITFTDRSGTLMALKSDVTLSLIRKMKDTDSIRRVMYNEKIYRIPEFSSSFREIDQTGLECMGPLTLDNVVEVVSLALTSLREIGGRCCLALSHMGIINSLLGGIEDEKREELTALLRRRKKDALKEKGETDETLRKAVEILEELLEERISGLELCSRMRKMGLEREAVDELEAVISALGEDCVTLDFTSLGAFDYYNGIIMKGFIEGKPRPVLLGGEYSLLLERMKKRISRAIGFAIYMDEVEGMK